MKIPLTKILTAPQIRQLDEQTIAEQKITSLELMERASVVAKEFLSATHLRAGIVVWAGRGNNGGDGLAIARLLAQQGYDVDVWQVAHTTSTSPDCLANQRALPSSVRYRLIQTTEDLALVPCYKEKCMIDALLGSGMSRPVSEDSLLGRVIEKINNFSRHNQIISIDIASGLPPDMDFVPSVAVKPHQTLSFELPKLAFMLPQNHAYVGEHYFLPIGLSPKSIEQFETPYYYFTAESAQGFELKRPKFSHKGTFGHVLVWGGSYSKIGAVTLAVKAALHSGAGLVTAYVPRCGYIPLQTAVPEAICLTDTHEQYLTQVPDLSRYDAVVAGVGMDTQPISIKALQSLLQSHTANLVLDADALNLIAEYKLLKSIPPNTVLTPHPKEFERLFGKSTDDKARLEMLRRQAITLKARILLKGAHTAVAYPDGRVLFNSSGSPAMATAGSGDVLSGILGAKLADSRYAHLPEIVSYGVYLHGVAGERAVVNAGYSQAFVTASEIIRQLAHQYNY